MQWIHKFDLFLFDFDGLLVNTEDLHFAAYRNMCRQRGFQLDWNLSQFFEAAHLSSSGLKEAIYRDLPTLQQQEPKWDVLYAEKKAAYQALLEKGEVDLLPGAGDLLKALEQAGKKRCVVTNSAKVQIDLIKERLPILQTISTWFTRETYREPKPSPECYLKALKELAEPSDRIIGFEDSMRGLRALRDAGVAISLLICPPDHPQLKHGIPEGFYFPSIPAIPDSFEL